MSSPRTDAPTAHPGTQPGPQIFYSAELDATDWARRHARGEVADRWPYGLDRLPGEPVSTVRTRADWTLRARVLRKLDNRFDWAARAPRSRRAVCWDERTGVPVAASQRDGAVATGIIWLTDRRHHRGARDRFVREALARCDRIWVNSEAQLEPLHRYWRIPDERLAYLPFGIDEHFWCPAESTADAPDAADKRTADVIVVGNDRDRDHALAVRALSRVQPRAARAVRLSLHTRHDVAVPPALGERLPGFTHLDLRASYRSAALAVVATRPNLHVSGSTATLEAMACALPVVVSDTPGMADYIEHGVTGLLVPPGDERALGDAVLSVLADPAAAAAMGRAARAAVEDRFTTAAMTDRLAEALG